MRTGGVAAALAVFSLFCLPYCKAQEQPAAPPKAEEQPAAPVATEEEPAVPAIAFTNYAGG